MACSSCGQRKCCCDEKVITKIGKAGGKGKQGPPGPAGPAGPTNLTVKNVVYVMKNGNDGTGLVERLDKPFLTIAAARAAALIAFTARSATARVKIVVETGLYNENILLDAFIDYDLGDSEINGCITDNFQEFEESDPDVWTNLIYGNFRVYNQRALGSGDYVAAFFASKPNTKVCIWCDAIASKNDDSVVVENGIVRIYANKIFSEGTSA